MAVDRSAARNAPSKPYLTDEWVPTDERLWTKVLMVARGQKREFTRVGPNGPRTIHAPHHGRGFRHWPNPKAIAWAVKQYNGFGGKWKGRDEEEAVTARAVAARYQASKRKAIVTYSYDRRIAALSPEEARAVEHLTKEQRAGLDEDELAKVAKGILRIQKDSAIQRAKGKNPYASRPFNNSKNKFDINFYAPNSRGEMRVYSWTGDSLSLSDRAEPATFETEAEANSEIRAKVLAEIRRYHPGDDVFILGW